MKTFSFEFSLDGPEMTDDDYEALYEAGCDDGTFGACGVFQHVSFDREAPSLAAAVMSAIEAVESTVPGVIVTRVELDDLVTASVIAKRTGRSRESVRLLIEGKRGRGEFPSPVPWVEGARLWEWSEVAHWLKRMLGESTPLGAGGEFIAALNGALQIRRHAPQLSDREEREAVAGIVRQDAERLELKPKAIKSKAVKPKAIKPKPAKPKAIAA